MPRYVDAEKIKYTEYINGDVVVSKDLIEKIPTVDVQEVRHGRWREDEETGDLQCSECGHFTDEILGDYVFADEKIANALKIPNGTAIHRSMHPFYCSKCGAKMYE